MSIRKIIQKILEDRREGSDAILNHYLKTTPYMKILGWKRKKKDGK